MQLSFRLLSVIKEIGNVSTLADIGTDHGQLLFYALKRNICQYGYGVDISEKSLLKARNLFSETELNDKVEFIHGNGLEGLPKVPDVIVIAGMGGHEIVSILKARKLDTRYIFLPHADARVLRQYLCEANFKIINDYVIKDNKFYSVITAVKGVSNYTKSEIILGANRPQSEYFNEFLEYRKRKIENILAQNADGKTKIQNDIKEEYEAIKECLR